VIDIAQRLANEALTGVPFNIEEYLGLADWQSARGEIYPLPMKSC
jgi:hypothetical protein